MTLESPHKKKNGNLKLMLKFKHFTNPGIDIFFVRRPCFLGWVFKAYYPTIWMFPKIGVPQNGWFTMENLSQMDDLKVYTLFFGGETPLFDIFLISNLAKALPSHHLQAFLFRGICWQYQGLHLEKFDGWSGWNPKGSGGEIFPYVFWGILRIN